MTADTPFDHKGDLNDGWMTFNIAGIDQAHRIKTLVVKPAHYDGDKQTITITVED